MVWKEQGLKVVTESDSSDESDVLEDNFGVGEEESNDEDIDKEESDSSSDEEETKSECKPVMDIDNGIEGNDSDDLSS